MIFWSRRTSNINETGHETWKGNLKKKLPLGQKYISKFTHASSSLGSSPSTIWQWSWASISNPQMETNAGGLREGEGGKAGALLLPAAQVSNSIVTIIINNITTIITTITITAAQVSNTIVKMLSPMHSSWSSSSSLLMRETTSSSSLSKHCYHLNHHNYRPISR